VQECHPIQMEQTDIHERLICLLTLVAYASAHAPHLEFFDVLRRETYRRADPKPESITPRSTLDSQELCTTLNLFRTRTILSVGGEVTSLCLAPSHRCLLRKGIIYGQCTADLAAYKLSSNSLLTDHEGEVWVALITDLQGDTIGDKKRWEGA